jgi:uncharacterized damage-inducible protein DinB
MVRTDIPPTWDERATLATFLDYTRGTVHRKCEGISEEHARSTPLTTSPLMSIAGVVNHLRWVEWGWFEYTLHGAEDIGPSTAEDVDGDFRVANDVPLARVLAEYSEQAARYRELVAGLDLDMRSVRQLRSTGDTVTLRWILFHLIEETARHNGHIDLLRELADGTTGY